jgi:hypothetical protein
VVNTPPLIVTPYSVTLEAAIGVDGAPGVGHRAAAIQRQGSSIRRLQVPVLVTAPRPMLIVRGVVIRVGRSWLANVPLLGEPMLPAP